MLSTTENPNKKTVEIPLFEESTVFLILKAIYKESREGTYFVQSDQTAVGDVASPSVGGYSAPRKHIVLQRINDILKRHVD